MIQMHHFRPRWLIQGKLIVAQQLIHFHLQHIQGDVVLLLRPENLEARGKVDANVNVLTTAAG